MWEVDTADTGLSVVPTYYRLFIFLRNALIPGLYEDTFIGIVSYDASLSDLSFSAL